MSADAPEATDNDSRDRVSARSRGGTSTRLMPTVGALRLLLAVVGVIGAVLTVVSAFSTVIEIKVLTATSLATDFDTDISGLDRHGPALIIIAAFGLAMLAGAVLRAARPAMAAVAAAGAICLGIAIVSDADHIHDTGEVGQLYESASADAGSGFFLETLGGALMLIAGGGLLVLSGVPSGPSEPRERTPREPRRRRRPATEDEPPEPRESRGPEAKADDWFS